MLLPNTTKNLLQESVQELAADPSNYAVHPGKDFTRHRKLDFQNLTRMLLTMEADSIKGELYNYFDYNTQTPSKTAFYNQRKKLSDTAFSNLCHSFNSKLPRTLYKDKYTIAAVDGSDVDIAYNPDDADTYYNPKPNSTRGFNQLHVNALFSVTDKRFMDFVIQPGKKKNEYSAFCQLIDNSSYPKRSMISMGDMGYASYNNYAHVIENNQFFVIRCNDKRLKGILRKPIDGLGKTDCHIDIILARTQAKKKFSHPELADQYRYVAKNVPFDYITEDNPEYKMHLRIVRIELKPGHFENLITNLPECDFSSEDFKELYHLRWSEETAFRDLKYPLCLNKFHSKKTEYIIQEIWARAILYNFCAVIATGIEIVKQNCIHAYKINFSQAVKICRDFLRRGNHSDEDVITLIKQNIEPVRDDRVYERRHRSCPPLTFCYRN